MRAGLKMIENKKLRRIQVKGMENCPAVEGKKVRAMNAIEVVDIQENEKYEKIYNNAGYLNHSTSRPRNTHR